MRFMMLMYPGPEAETETSPVPPGPEGQKLLQDMMAFNQRMVDAGVMKGGDGLKPITTLLAAALTDKMTPLDGGEGWRLVTRLQRRP